MPSEPTTKGGHRYLCVGKYQVLKHIATGGMGVVYRARNQETGLDVALKILAPELVLKPLVVERFRREAELGQKLRHENLVSIYEFGEASGTYYLALEFVDGVDLQEYIHRARQLGAEESRHLLIQAVRALDYVHNQGVVHRDVKPSNFMIARRDGKPLVKLTDLGLARVARDDEFRLTRMGSTVGTIDYMAPEQARDSGAADIRSDIYSLGCTWYHMLTGQPPFAEGSLTERIYRHSEAKPADVREFNPGVPARQVRILQQMLAKRPADRYQTPSELLTALEGDDRSAGDAAPFLPQSQPADISAAPRSREDLAALGEQPPTPARVNRRKRSSHGRPDKQSPAPARREPADEPSSVAAGQFTRAVEAVAAGNLDYGIELLLSCCKRDPANLFYRQALRRAEKTKFPHARAGNALTWLSALPLQAKLKGATRRRDHAGVLETGEEILAHNPWHVGVQREMADAAEKLGLADLAAWILEEARQTDPQDVPVNRALARLYEQGRKYAQAIALWECVRQEEPDDAEARNKTRDLAARETILRGQYHTEVERRQPPSPERCQ